MEAAGDVDPVPATPLTRLAGALVDGGLLQILALPTAGLAPGPAAVAATTAYLVYEVGAVVAWGRTAGKLAMGARVVDAAGGGGGVRAGRPAPWQAVTRAVTPMAGVAVDVVLGTQVVGVFWALAVYGSVLTDERRRGLHDRLAGTMVLAVGRSPAHQRAGRAAVLAALALVLALAVASYRQDPTTAGALARRIDVESP